jgi:hypothetical protein
MKKLTNKPATKKQIASKKNKPEERVSEFWTAIMNEDTGAVTILQTVVHHDDK